MEVLGGFFVAILAPRIFKTYVELPLCGMVICAFLTLVIGWKETVRSRLRPYDTVARGAGGASQWFLHWYMFACRSTEWRSHYHLQVRNFYGVLQVRDFETGDEDGRVRSLFHGTVEHGAQLLDPDRRYDPTMYYVRSSGIGLAMAYLKAHGAVRVGAIGLGAGVLASYCRVGGCWSLLRDKPSKS